MARATRERPRTTARTNGDGAGALVRGARAAGRGLEIVFDVRTVYDFVIGIGREPVDDDLAPDDRRWMASARDRLAEAVGPAFERSAAADLAWGLGILAVDRPDVRTAREFVGLIEGLSPADLARTLFSDELLDPGLRPLVEGMLAGDAASREALLTRAEECSPAARLGLVDRPDDYRDDILALLRAWLPIFEEVEGRVGAMIRRDADGHLGDAATTRPLELVEGITGGIRWIPEPGVRRLILAPTYFSRPFNYILAGEGWRFFGYPIADEALDAADPTAPPASLLRLHHALGDESRLRILALLAERDQYLTELAGRLELSKPTVKHHLAQLRAAGLVTVTEEGSLTYWSLRRERIGEASRELARFLG